MGLKERVENSIERKMVSFIDIESIEALIEDFFGIYFDFKEHEGIERDLCNYCVKLNVKADSLSCKDIELINKKNLSLLVSNQINTEMLLSYISSEGYMKEDIYIVDI